MKNRKKKIRFKELIKSIRKPICKPTQTHNKKTKKELIEEIRSKDE